MEFSTLQPSLGFALILLVVGIFILALELFVPSAGMLFIAASFCIIGSVVIAFLSDLWHGVGVLVLVTVLAFVLPGIGIRIWRRTYIGRRMFLETPEETAADEQPEAAAAETTSFDAHSLMGEVGRTLTSLRPSGTTEFFGRRVDAVAEGVMIDEGVYIRVVGVQGQRVKVRRLTERELDALSFDPE